MDIVEELINLVHANTQDRVPRLAAGGATARFAWHAGAGRSAALRQAAQRPPERMRFRSAAARRIMPTGVMALRIFLYVRLPICVEVILVSRVSDALCEQVGLCLIEHRSFFINDVYCSSDPCF